MAEADRAPRHPATLAAQALGRVDPRTRAIVPGIEPATTFLRDPDGGYALGPDLWARRQPDLRAGRGPAERARGRCGLAAVRLGHGGGDWRCSRRWIPATTRSCRAPCTGRCAPGWSSRPPAGGSRSSWSTRPTWTRSPPRCGPAGPAWSGSRRPPTPCGRSATSPAAAEIAHRAGARLAVDSTVATPVLTRPLALGADLVMHSATKYLNGHSDVIAGTLTTARRRRAGGRGSRRSAPGRAASSAASRRGCCCAACARCSCACAKAAARPSTSPSTSPGIRPWPRCSIPGLPGFPGHALAARQMRAGSAACCRSGCAAARRRRSRPPHGSGLWKRATSLGGVESLIEHRASIEGPTSPVPPDLLRLSVGIEEPDDLIADLEAALR